MAQKIKKTCPIVALLCLLGLAACSSPTPTPTSAPTQDLNPFRTEVASTVFAQVTHDLALTPSITPLPTKTPTTAPTNTPAQVTGSTPAQSTVAFPGVTVTLPIVTLVTPAPVLTDRAQWVSQSVADDTVFAPGQTFTMTWSMKNVGNSTWTTNYLLRYYSGDLFGAPKEIRLSQEVLPGGVIEINIKMKAPAAAGKYYSAWVLSNQDRANFKEAVFLKITVALPPTATRAPTPTPTP